MQSNYVPELAEALFAFDPEAGGPADRVSERGPALAQTTSPVGWISLEDLVSRDISIEWDEAVAVVEDLCTLVTAGAKESRIPELGGILITAGGGVTLSSVGGEPGANAAGRTLNALLSSSANVPVPLRLFVTQSTAPEIYGSVREFAAALAYFSKPGRAELIRALYRRGAAALAAAPSVAPRRKPQPDAMPVLRKPDTSKPTRTRPAWANPALVAVAATTVLAVGIWLWSGETPGLTADSSTIIAQATNTLQRLAGNVPESPRIGAPPRVDHVEPNGPAPVAGTNRVAPATRPAAAMSAAAEGARATVTPSPEEEIVSVILTDILPSPHDVEARAPRGDELPFIYSSADANVEPPTLLYTQLPRPFVVNRGHAVQNAMEVVVSQLGTVERVRLIAGPTRMPDMMLLSGVKTWQFRPAMKGDVPVRYRAILSWSSAP